MTPNEEIRQEASSAPKGPGLQLRLATKEDLPLLEALNRAQLEALAAFNPHVNPDNGLQSDWLEKPGVLFPWLFERAWEQGAPEALGFALVGNHKLSRAMGFQEDFLIWEFHVAAAARRQGIGAAALQLLYEQHPGTWTVEVLPNNGPAMGFWSGCLAPLLTGTTEREDDEGTTFVRYSFSTGPS